MFKIYEELISSYNSFAKYNEILYEKIYIYAKELFNLYIDSLELRMDNHPDNQEIIKQIKIIMLMLIKEQNYVENLMMLFKDIRETCKNEFYRIFVNYMEIFNNEGLKRIKMGKYSRYYGKIYLEKIFFGIKRFVNADDLGVIDINIKKFYEQQKAKTEEELKKLNSFAFYIEMYVNEGKFLFGNTGFTKIAKQIEEFFKNKDPTQEEIQNILDLFHNMANSFDEKKRLVGEAYCYANIIEINYDMLNVKDYERLESYIEKFEYIMKGKDKESYPWYNKVKSIIDLVRNSNE